MTRFLRLFKTFNPRARLVSSQLYSSASTSGLKDGLHKLIPQKQAEVKQIKEEHGSKPLGEITVDMVYGGMCGIKGLIWEGSVLDADKGICFHGLFTPKCQKSLPATDGGNKPLPELLFWLLLTGEVPNPTQVQALSKDWASCSVILNVNNLFHLDFPPSEGLQMYIKLRFPLDLPL